MRYLGEQLYPNSSWGGSHLGNGGDGAGYAQEEVCVRVIKGFIHR